MRGIAGVMWNRWYRERTVSWILNTLSLNLTNLETGMTDNAPALDVILVPGVCFDAKFQRVSSRFVVYGA